MVRNISMSMDRSWRRLTGSRLQHKQQVLTCRCRERVENKNRKSYDNVDETQLWLIGIDPNLAKTKNISFNQRK